MKNGRYVYRFDGYTSRDTAFAHVVGIGSMTLRDGSIIDGAHSASITKLTGADLTAYHGTFSLTGNFASAGDMFHAIVNFVETTPGAPNPEKVVGEFDFIESGVSDRYWLISTSTKDVTAGPILTNEVVSGEAMLIVDGDR